jgi:hypothetical protein
MNTYIEQEQKKYSEQEHQEYKEKLLAATKRLIDLGICDLEWTNITDGVNLLVDKLHQREIAVYGKVRSKEELKNELKAINQRIADLDQQLVELDKKIADKQIAKAMELFRESA